MTVGSDETDDDSSIPNAQNAVERTILTSVALRCGVWWLDLGGQTMDVALDANEFLADPRMQSVRFQTLLAYLRKTQSRLLISKIVWDEVIARYPERISTPYHKAANDVRTLRSLLLARKIPELPELDTEKEVSALKKKLKEPSPYVRGLILRNFGDVSIEEVAKRGIQRTPPASPKGEELRDVMVWLMMLGHAKKTGRDIALISHDEHFRENEGLHPRLKEDLEQGAIKLHFYKAIDDFIKAHAPSPKTLTEDEAFQFVSRQFLLDTFEIEARRLFPRYWGSSTEVEVSDRKIKFVRAALYDVGGGSQFGEMEVTGDLDLSLTRTEYSYVNTIDTLPAFGPAVGLKGDVIPTGFVGSATLQNWDELGWASVKGLPLMSTPVRLDEPLDWKSLPYKVTTSMPVFSPTSKKMSEAMLKGEMTVSFRVVSGRVTKFELENLRIVEIQNRSSTQN